MNTATVGEAVATLELEGVEHIPSNFEISQKHKACM